MIFGSWISVRTCISLEKTLTVVWMGKDFSLEKLTWLFVGGGEILCAGRHSLLPTFISHKIKHSAWIPPTKHNVKCNGIIDEHVQLTWKIKYRKLKWVKVTYCIIIVMMFRVRLIYNYCVLVLNKARTPSNNIAMS